MAGGDQHEVECSLTKPLAQPKSHQLHVTGYGVHSYVPAAEAAQGFAL